MTGLGFPSRKFGRFFARYKLEAILLFGLSAAASLLALPFPLIVFAGLTILLVGGYITFKRETAQETQKFLEVLKPLLDDFSSYFLDAKEQHRDFRVTRMLNMGSFGEGTSITKEEASAIIEGIRKCHEIFKFWHSTIRDKVQLMTRRKMAILEWDLTRTVEDFFELCNSYTEVADRGVLVVSKAKFTDSRDVKTVFNVFRQNHQHVRSKANTFLKSYTQVYSITAQEMEALKNDLD